MLWAAWWDNSFCSHRPLWWRCRADTVHVKYIMERKHENCSCLTIMVGHAGGIHAPIATRPDHFSGAGNWETHEIDMAKKAGEKGTHLSGERSTC